VSFKEDDRFWFERFAVTKGNLVGIVTEGVTVWELLIDGVTFWFEKFNDVG
jgi:hypothetical protein